MKAAIYTRVSTPEQKNNLQLNDLKKYAQQRQFTIYRIYQDTISGSINSRPELNQLFNDAKKRKFNTILVWKFDRFARSLKMLVDSLQLFNELGIDFISYQENIDTTTSMGKLIYHINSAYAEFERELISIRVKAGIQAKRKRTNGKWGRSPLELQIRNKISILRAQNISIRNIARNLNISTATVQKYMSN